MAIACFRLVTFFPLRPLFSFPRFISFISVSTFFPAEGEYFRDDDFLEDDFFADFLLDEDLCDLDFEEEELFLAAFFVAIQHLLRGQMVGSLPAVARGQFRIVPILVPAIFPRPRDSTPDPQSAPGSRPPPDRRARTPRTPSPLVPCATHTRTQDRLIRLPTAAVFPCCLLRIRRT